MAEKSITPETVTALDRLLYVGTRGMGALEYHPAADLGDGKDTNTVLDIHLLAFGRYCNLPDRKTNEIISSITGAFRRFGYFAQRYDVGPDLVATVTNGLRLYL